MQIKENPMDEIVQAFKGGGYKTPGKLLIWGMALGQWMALIIIGGMFLVMLITTLIMTFEPGQRVRARATHLKQTKLTEQKINAENNFIDHIKDMAQFMEVSTKSVNERQEILDSVLDTVSSYMGQPLDQKTLEQKLRSLSSDLRHCNTARGRYLSDFSSTINPFENPEVSKIFKELIGDDTFIGRHVLNPQEENKRWKILCNFCHEEVKKATRELAGILNTNIETSSEMFTEPKREKTNAEIFKSRVLDY